MSDENPTDDVLVEEYAVNFWPAPATRRVGSPSLTLPALSYDEAKTAGTQQLKEYVEAGFPDATFTIEKSYRIASA